MKKLSSYKTTDGAQVHREGAKNGIREFEDHWIYPESWSNAKIEKVREGAVWIIKPIAVIIIQIRIFKSYLYYSRNRLKITKPLAKKIFNSTWFLQNNSVKYALLFRRPGNRAGEGQPGGYGGTGRHAGFRFRCREAYRFKSCYPHCFFAMPEGRQYIPGALAQLGAHNTGSVGVRGSNPLCSTTRRRSLFTGLRRRVFSLRGDSNPRGFRR